MSPQPSRSCEPSALIIRRFAGGVRNLPLVVSLARRFLHRGSAATRVAALRALPRPLVSQLRHWLPLDQSITGAIAAWKLGDTLAAIDALKAMASGGKAQALDTLIALHAYAAAQEAAETLPNELGARSRARLLLAQGHLYRAREAVDGGWVGRSLAHQIDQEIASLTNYPRAAVDPPGFSEEPVRRVCHLVTTALPEAQTGYTLRTQGIAAGQLAQGIEPIVVSRLGFPADTGVLGAWPYAKVEGVAYRRLLPPWVPAGASDRLDASVEQVTAIARRWQPELIHCHSKHDNAQVGLAVAQRLELPMVYEVRGFLEETWRTAGGSPSSERYRLSREMETRCMTASGAVVTLSRSMRRELLDRSIDSERVFVVPNGVAPSFLQPVPARREIREQLALPTDALIVGTAGTLNHYEGVDVLVESLSKLSGDVVLLVVGAGPALASLKEQVHSLGIRAVFPGRVPHAQVRPYICAMDLFAVPRRRTPVTALVPPLKPLEALASGVPVLVSALEPLEELVEDSGAGVVAPAGDPGGWREAMQMFVQDPQHCRSLGHAGRLWAARERSWPAIAARYDAVYGRARG